MVRISIARFIRKQLAEVITSVRTYNPRTTMSQADPSGTCEVAEGQRESRLHEERAATEVEQLGMIAP